MAAKGKYIDLTGHRYGRLVPLRFVRRTQHRASIWLCQCDCGKQVEVEASNMRRGNSTSCGCYHIETTVARCTYLPPGGRDTPTYESWTAMRARCVGRTGRRAVDYSLRGITCCDRWASYLDFLADMGERPAGTTLDRKDNSKGYEPGNCRWATASQQVTNRRSSVEVRRDRAALAAAIGLTIGDIERPDFRPPSGAADINDRNRFPLRTTLSGDQP